MDLFNELSFTSFWYGLAALLLLLEALFGGFKFIPISFAALAAGLLSQLYPTSSLSAQLLFFGVLASSFLIAAHKWAQSRRNKE